MRQKLLFFPPTVRPSARRGPVSDDGDARSRVFVDWGVVVVVVGGGGEVRWAMGGFAFPVVLFWRCCNPRGPQWSLWSLAR